MKRALVVLLVAACGGAEAASAPPAAVPLAAGPEASCKVDDDWS